LLSTVGDRAFPVAAAHVWNSLPEQRVPADLYYPPWLSSGPI